MEKPLFRMVSHINASFLQGYLPVFHPKNPGLFEMGSLECYPQKIILYWGVFRRKTKEIPVASIKEFSVYDMGLREHVSQIRFIENSTPTKLYVIPNSFYNEEFTKYLRDRIPEKEKKEE